MLAAKGIDMTLNQGHIIQVETSVSNIPLPA